MGTKLQLVDLDVAIKSLIVDQLHRPSDLKNVCLVKKQLHELAVKPLYRHVNLDLGSSNDNRLTAFCNPRNIGLQHIRQIRLYLAKVRDTCNQKQQAAFATRMILEFLPENTIEEFSWCPWEPFSADNLMLLYKRQRRLKWLEVMDLDRSILPALKKDTALQADLFANARKLALYPENRETLDACQYFVEKTADVLEDLIIHANFDTHDLRDHSPSTDSVDPRELNDSATGPGLLMRKIFGHSQPFETATPLRNLKALRLHRINLRHCADTWCRVVDFQRVESLRLYQCPGVDSLLGQMSKAAQLPKQLKVLEFQHKDNAENEALIALDGFLCLVSGIRELVIDMVQVKHLPAAAGIARHGRTLESLNVHGSESCGHLTSSDGEYDELVYDIDDFEKIAQSCVKLEQLSCAWPSTSLIRSPEAEWQAFENAALGNLSKLVTLQITTFPSNKPSTQLLPKSVYEQLLQGLAERLFERARNGTAKSDTNSVPSLTDHADASADSSPGGKGHGKLNLIAFGISEKIYEREDSRNQLLFLRSTAKTALGADKVYAAPVGWCLRQFLEPRSDVLDFVLMPGRESRVPCREREIAWGDDDELEFT
ncbi:hypothetical protein EJ03DRAFT_387566 [Teratosphaeria nubilosa]|uniref:Uncharacterized protein n=1 Tax=Teratosphaeria nubilosa TaxID=161662 RepID=A0A6G1LHV0_9PEZI|nr:hypothetical protein EJ03DRAFT_387566 [Teratosphaeria nubilosa]